MTKEVREGGDSGVLAPRIDRPVPCSKCSAIPTVKARQFRTPPWNGKTGWRVFCGTGEHAAGSGYRAHKADAIRDWNTLQAFAERTGKDPAKRCTLSDALAALEARNV